MRPVIVPGSLDDLHGPGSGTDLLIRAWPVLGMTRVKRDAWERKFPVLRQRRLAAAA